MKVLVTGAAGFVGSHTVEQLLARGHSVLGLDAFDDYYDPTRKRLNLTALENKPGFDFIEGDLSERKVCDRAVRGQDAVVHVAARPGVRASIDDPLRTYDMNLTATLVLLEAMRNAAVSKLIFASTSSVYGGDAPLPFREDSPSSRPLSPYAASKRACELLIASYVELHGLGAFLLRLFTVYGPRGRPDMSVGKFIESGLGGRPVPLFGDGSVEIDFTYVEDIARGLATATEKVKPGDLHLANLGGSERASMQTLIGEIERAIGKKLVIEKKPKAPGDAPVTWADTQRAANLLGWRAQVRLPEGIDRTVAWAKKAIADHPRVYG